MPPSCLTSPYTLPFSVPTFYPLTKPNILFSSPTRPQFLKTLPPAPFISRSAFVSFSPSANLLSNSKPSPAENSRTIMELSSSGSLSTLTPDGWPIGIGAQFVVDAQGSPALCIRQHIGPIGGNSSFHVQLEQSGSRTGQCTLIGSLKKPDDGSHLKKLCAKWEKKFGEEVDERYIYVISVERVLHIEDFKEEGVWVSSSEYLNAEPDPLRTFAEQIVDDMNSQHAEDVQRLCKVYVDSEIQVTHTKIVWVDRLGFDLYLYSEKGVFGARIPFPREVTDEKGVKSSFNSMSHLAWQIQKSYAASEFEKVKCLKKIR